MGLFDKLFFKKEGRDVGNHTVRAGIIANEFEAHYFVGNPLGSGAFAIVKEAIRKSDGSKFAVKIVDKTKIKGQENLIAGEIAVLKQLSHPNILLANIVHRDLKPENVIFADSSETSRVLLTDFGLSKIVKTNQFLTTSCGTPHYVPPEILKDHGHGTPVDMWSLGVITYVLLSGYTPFWGGETNSTTVLYQAIVEGSYEYDPENWDKISADAKNFISKLLLVDPSKRMTAAEALKHPWLHTEAAIDLLPNMRKNFDAKKTFKKAFLALATIRQASVLGKTKSSDSVDHAVSPISEN
ncbi:hypothetical protein BATDEDRAFT_89426 [Batrachochytrium dendrobatidis JAM81]|uniref:Protein kinase domain-containing protein n=1 Tax=Batrachochytrium dendrobatidis (strain JAM81 / FGSC 10211) TaxID=684364 RepID=F4P470_BATDJ|nr:uncharacterized protein BATDEDRAFT_89426 [Batrachochytrium dendrobatidis JAM81]EGF79735.1 hypothetical protein BATDEDRAFT_89426 [Batrachochytrium dendrobatidis JAM81]|eukprot:XP_006679660.1 hypothetical protein BATDEDRAFT_89426 [Batrachochytrium dendrobatidis JAM81]